jgi:hypothetical protein
MTTYYQLEDGSGVYVLEDGSGNYLRESNAQSLARTIKKTEAIAATLGVTMAIIRMVKGDTIDIVYTISDSAGNVEDLTGGSISWKALRSGSTTAEITKTGALTDASNGVTTISLDPADTTSLGGTYAIQGVYTDSGASVYTFDDGALIVETDDPS